MTATATNDHLQRVTISIRIIVVGWRLYDGKSMGRNTFGPSHFLNPRGPMANAPHGWKLEDFWILDWTSCWKKSSILGVVWSGKRIDNGSND